MIKLITQHVTRVLHNKPSRCTNWTTKKFSNKFPYEMTTAIIWNSWLDSNELWPFPTFISFPILSRLASARVAVSSTARWRALVRYTINQQITNPNPPPMLPSENWLTAYCATRVDKIRSVLDHGQPIANAEIEQFLVRNNNLAGSSDMENFAAGIILRSQPENKDRIDGPFAHRYMSNSVFYRICCSFEVKVRTSSLKSIESTSQGCKIWTTKEANSCILTGLCICLVPV